MENQSIHQLLADNKLSDAEAKIVLQEILELVFNASRFDNDVTKSQVLALANHYKLPCLEEFADDFEAENRNFNLSAK